MKKRPMKFGLGSSWGGYDDFHQWQANGRQIRPEHMRRKDSSWQLDVREMVLVEEGSGKETKLDVLKGSALDAQVVTKSDELKSLYNMLHSGKKEQRSKRYPGGHGGGEWSSKKSARPTRFAGHGSPFDDVPRVSTAYDSPPRTPPKQALFEEDTISMFRPSMMSDRSGPNPHLVFDRNRGL
ncbi:hypothetical protein diail_4924 [Diaporthe ilicicola]|nr:hypothetical protein diail_4924 [Diaporthe ilicicola]